MAAYSSELTLRDARQQYFVLNGFGDGGYQATWVKLKAGPIPIYFPNTKARVRAVKFHDVHHVLTEYQTTWSGEAEIGAWEIASGCGRHYPAWLLNLNAFAIGLSWLLKRSTERSCEDATLQTCTTSCSTRPCLVKQLARFARS